MSDFERKKPGVLVNPAVKAASDSFHELSTKDQTIVKLRALTARLHRAQEEERNSLAREIHDEMAQSLTSLKLDLARLHDNLADREPIKRTVESASRAVDVIIQNARRIASELRPPLLDDFGLTAAIEWRLDDFEKRTGIRLEFKSDLGDCTIEPDHSIGIFRILQEALTNVARHSKAKTARISLRRQKERLMLKVSDTGIGIRRNDVTGPRSLGVLEMQERAMALGGELTVAKSPAGGTEVRAVFPLCLQFDKKETVANSSGNSSDRLRGGPKND